MTTAAGIAEVRAESDLYLGLYRRMLLIRRFEETIQTLFTRGEVHGTTHLYSGQEAVAVGVASVLDERDRVAGTYRGHGHGLALGMDAGRFLAEMTGRVTGTNGGRAGSMNVNSIADRFLGSYGIVGGTIATAVGAALSARRTGGVAVAYFGDGATNQAYFFECLNFAQVKKLPAVFVCENNRYGEYTPFETVTAGAIMDRAGVFGLRTEQVDGMSVWAVRAAARRAVDHARSGAGPAFMEMLTYRFVGHSRSDPGAYRKPGELDEWKLRDPLTLTRAALEEAGVAAADLDALEAEVDAEIEAHTEAALTAPWPAPEANVPEYA
jgi:TPP-dependent pyruvate/acetoin dehydrogenase alpha subunit